MWGCRIERWVRTSEGDDVGLDSSGVIADDQCGHSRIGIATDPWYARTAAYSEQPQFTFIPLVSFFPLVSSLKQLLSHSHVPGCFKAPLFFMPTPEPVFQTLPAGVVIRADREIYSREAVLRATYWITDRCYVLIRQPDSKVFEIDIRLKADEKTASGDLEAIAGELANSLLDYQLREEVSRETEQVRSLLIAKAFAESGILDDPIPGDLRDPVEVRRDSLVQIELGALA